MTSSLYLYYRPQQADAALAHRLRAMQAELARRTGIDGQLMRRCDDAATWMEVYPEIQQRPQFEQALQQCLLAHGLLEACGERHTEWFENWPQDAAPAA